MNSFPAELGIILVDHGSIKDDANRMLLDVVERFRTLTGAAIVEPAHMELAPPSITDAFAACVRQGAKKIVVHPYFLAPGRHSTNDIPRMVAEAAAAHPGVTYTVSEPLGLDDRLIAAAADRIREAADN